MLQQTALIELITALKAQVAACHVEVETNGSIAPNATLAALIDQFNVSPKLAHSGNELAVRRKLDVLSAYARMERAFLKIVVQAPEDFDEVVDLAKAAAFPSSRIFIMPEGITSATLRERAGWISALCVEHGFSFTDRMHIHLYGDTRGT